MPTDTELLVEIRDLLRVIATPELRKRDREAREKIAAMCGRSAKRRAAILLIDGAKTRAQIQQAAPIDQGELSRLISSLKQEELCTEEFGKPKIWAVLDKDMFVNNGAEE